MKESWTSGISKARPWAAHLRPIIVFIPLALLLSTIAVLTFAGYALPTHPEWWIYMLASALKAVPTYLAFVMERTSAQLHFEFTQFLFGPSAAPLHVTPNITATPTFSDPPSLVPAYAAIVGLMWKALG